MSLPTSQYTPPLQYRCTLSNKGRLHLPAQLRKVAKLKDGDELILTVKDDIIQIQLLDHVINDVQDLVASYFAEDNLTPDLEELRNSDASAEQEQNEENEQSEKQGSK